VVAENSRALEVKLGETEGELAAKTEALNLLQTENDKFQAEVNKLQVEKEFLEKQLATKTPRSRNWRRPTKTSSTIWMAPLMRGSRRL